MIEEDYWYDYVEGDTVESPVDCARSDRVVEVLKN